MVAGVCTEISASTWNQRVSQPLLRPTLCGGALPSVCQLFTACASLRLLLVWSLRVCKSRETRASPGLPWAHTRFRSRSWRSSFPEIPWSLSKPALAPHSPDFPPECAGPSLFSPVGHAALDSCHVQQLSLTVSDKCPGARTECTLRQLR